MSAENEIRVLLESWAKAVRDHDLDAIVNDRSRDIVMFDVPEPLQSRGLEAYKDTWRFYFENGEGSRRYELKELRIAASEDLAWAHALLICTSDPEPAGRLSVGLRKIGGRWIVEHEHHSFPAKSDALK